MPKYRVTLSRFMEQEATLYIDAETPMQAQALAQADKDKIWHDVGADEGNARARTSEEVDHR